VNDVARSPLNEAFRGPPKNRDLRLQPCQPSGKPGTGACFLSIGDEGGFVIEVVRISKEK